MEFRACVLQRFFLGGCTGRVGLRVLDPCNLQDIRRVQVPEVWDSLVGSLHPQKF